MGECNQIILRLVPDRAAILNSRERAPFLLFVETMELPDSSSENSECPSATEAGPPAGLASGASATRSPHATPVPVDILKSMAAGALGPHADPEPASFAQLGTDRTGASGGISSSMPERGNMGRTSVEAEQADRPQSAAGLDETGAAHGALLSPSLSGRAALGVEQSADLHSELRISTDRPATSALARSLSLTQQPPLQHQALMLQAAEAERVAQAHREHGASSATASAGVSPAAARARPADEAAVPGPVTEASQAGAGPSGSGAPLEARQARASLQSNLARPQQAERGADAAAPEAGPDALSSGVSRCASPDSEASSRREAKGDVSSGASAQQNAVGVSGGAAKPPLPRVPSDEALRQMATSIHVAKLAEPRGRGLHMVLSDAAMTEQTSRESSSTVRGRDADAALDRDDASVRSGLSRSASADSLRGSSGSRRGTADGAAAAVHPSPLRGGAQRSEPDAPGTSAQRQAPSPRVQSRDSVAGSSSSWVNVDAEHSNSNGRSARTSLSPPPETSVDDAATHQKRDSLDAGRGLQRNRTLQGTVGGLRKGGAGPRALAKQRQGHLTAADVLRMGRAEYVQHVHGAQLSDVTASIRAMSPYGRCARLPSTRNMQSKLDVSAIDCEFDTVASWLLLLPISFPKFWMSAPVNTQQNSIVCAVRLRGAVQQ